MVYSYVGSTVSWQIRLGIVVVMLTGLAAPLSAHPAPVLAAEAVPGIQVPQFVYETVYNPGFLDSGHDVAVDGDGNAFVLGWSYHSETENDINVSKIGPTGDVLWSVDIVGESLDFATGLTLDGNGDVYITGFTDSADFPLVDPLQGTLIGFRDAFVTKFSAADGAILYSTFLGGDYVDQGGDIAIGDTGDIYLVGLTESTDFPTVNPIQGELNGPPYAFSDLFITQLSADGQTILYSTYLGGTNDDQGISIALDGLNRIYVAGNTESNDFPNVGPIQPVNAGEGDALVVRIAADGGAVEYGTYLGGEDWDRVSRIAVNSAGEAFVAGSSRSFTFPTTPGAFQEEFVGADCSQPPFEFRNCDDAFVTKVAADGSAWAYSTFLAGNLDDEATGIALDGDDNAYLVGYTFSPDFPGAASTGIYLAKLNTSGSDLLYTVAKWSGSANAGHGIALDGVNDIYVTGAVNVPADIYVAKLSESVPPPDTMHVSNIWLGVTERNGRFILLSVAEVQDQNGDPVEGADVTVQISLPSGQTRDRSRMTNAMGRALFLARSLQGGTWQVCVTGVVKTGFTYAPDQNSETCDSTMYP